MTLNTYTGLFPDRLDVVADALDTARRTAVRTEGAFEARKNRYERLLIGMAGDDTPPRMTSRWS